MKTRLILLLEGLLIFSLLFTAFSEAEIDPETIVAAWLFDTGKGDAARDSSGRGHDGAFKGDVKRVKGKFGSAVEFDGNSVIEVPHADDQTLEVYTLVAWVNIPEVTGNFQAIVCKDGWPNRNYGIWVINNSGGIHHSFKTFGGGNNNTMNSPTQVTGGEWHHVAATYDQETMKTYIDGVLDIQKPMTDKPAVTDVSITMGKAGPGGSHPMNGAIDEVAIFDVALNEEEIRAIIENGLAEFVILAVNSRGKLAATWAGAKKW